MSAIQRDREIAVKAVEGPAHWEAWAYRSHNRQPLYDALVDAALGVINPRNPLHSSTRSSTTLMALYSALAALDRETTDRTRGEP